MLCDRRFAVSDRFGVLRWARVLDRPVRGDDATRPVAGRAERFLRRYTSKLWVFDAAALQLGSAGLAAGPLVADLVLGGMRLHRMAEHFGWWTGRLLMGRRCMWMIVC